MTHRLQLLLVEAVSQTVRGSTVSFAGGSAFSGVSAMSGVVTIVGAVSGRQGGYLAAINLGEVVGHHQ